MKTEKIKDTPLRTCVVCKKLLPKKEMLRIVKNKEGEVFIDYTNKANGRGAYICDSAECIEKCVNKKLLNKSFSMAISQEIYQKILEDYARSKS
ncbi:YlxR family protein [bacterium]|nr:YlxR family protein [bacterium]